MKLAIKPELLILGAAMFVGLAFAEGGLRLYAARSHSTVASELASDPFAALVRPHGSFGFRQTPNSVYRYPGGIFATSNAQGYRGPAVDSLKPPHTVRVILLGASTTHGWGTADDSTIDAFMRRELAARRPELGFEVINLAFDGYDSYQVLQRLHTDGLPRRPDLVIANLGTSDVANAKHQNLRYADERTLIWEPVLRRLRDEEARGGPRPWTRIKHYSYLARVPGIIRLHQRVRARDAAQRVEAIHPNLAAADYLERNLDSMVNLGTAAGACVFLSSDPSALSWYPPHAKPDRIYWIGDAAQTQVLRDTMDARVRHAAAQGAAAGLAVRYVPHHLAREGFLDDAHLSAAGNRALAHEFVEALLPLLPQPPAPYQGSLPACAARTKRGGV